MSYEIVIKDGEKQKCPNCNGIFAIKNDDGEILYRNITLLYVNTVKKKGKAKCKQCKFSIQIDLSNTSDTIVV